MRRSVKILSWFICLVLVGGFLLPGTAQAEGHVLNAEQAQIQAGPLTIFSEDFDTVSAPALPPGWMLTDVNGTTGTWITSTAGEHPAGVGAHSLPNMATFNSWTATLSDATRLYYDADLDLSPYSSITLSYWMYHDEQYTNTDYIQLQVSTDYGVTWTNVGPQNYRYLSGTSSWIKHEVDLSEYRGTHVRIAFLGYSNSGNDCYLDEIDVAGLMDMEFIFKEDFDSISDPALPPNWTQADVSNTAGEWNTSTAGPHPAIVRGHSLPNMAYFNSWAAAPGSSTRLSYSANLDLRPYYSVTLSYWMYHDGQYTNMDYIQVQVSTDQGVTWMDVGPQNKRFLESSYRWYKHEVDLSEYRGMHVRIAFLGTSNYGNDCFIDSILLAGKFYSMYLPVVTR